MYSDPSPSTKLIHAACLTFRHSIFGQAQKGINSLKGKFGRGKKADKDNAEAGSSGSDLDKEGNEDDIDLKTDQKDAMATVKPVEA